MDLVSRAKTTAKPVLFIAALVVLWQVLVALLQVPDYLLPAPSVIYGATAEGMAFFPNHIWVTFYETVVGFILAIVIGIALGMAIVQSGFFRDAVYPLLVISQVLPKVAIAPLFVLWFGYGLFPKIALTFVIAFFPVVVNTIAGLTAIEPEMIDLARTYHATPWKVFIKVRLPNSVPYIMTGLEVAITLCVVGAVVAEFVASDVGLGFLITLFSYQMKTASMFACFLWLSLMGLALYELVVYSKNLLTPWYVKKLRQTRVA